MHNEESMWYRLKSIIHAQNILSSQIFFVPLHYIYKVQEMTQEEMLSQMEMMLQPLQQVNASQAETIKKLTEQNESLQSRIKELTAQIAWLNRQLFGRKSEKLPIIDPNYPDLFAGMLPENAQQIADAHDEAVEKIIKTKEERRQEKKNRIMMEDLPVLEQVILTPDNLDTNLYKKIGQEVTRSGG